MTTTLSPRISSSDMLTILDKALITNEIVEELSSEFKGPYYEFPIVIVLGGFQGSGKSTLAEHLRKTHEFTVISTDAVRSKLAEKHIVGDLFSEMVSTISKVLLLVATQKHLDIVIDGNEQVMSIGEVSKLLQPYRDYRMMTIFLHAPEETLIKRLISRSEAESSNQGLIADLKKAIATSKVNLSNYDWSLKTDEATIEEEFRSIDSFLSQLSESEEEL